MGLVEFTKGIKLLWRSITFWIARDSVVTCAKDVCWWIESLATCLRFNVDTTSDNPDYLHSPLPGLALGKGFVIRESRKVIVGLIFRSCLICGEMRQYNQFFGQVVNVLALKARRSWVLQLLSMDDNSLPPLTKRPLSTRLSNCVSDIQDWTGTSLPLRNHYPYPLRDWSRSHRYFLALS